MKQRGNIDIQQHEQDFAYVDSLIIGRTNVQSEVWIDRMSSPYTSVSFLFIPSPACPHGECIWAINKNRVALLSNPIMNSILKF